MIDKEVLRVEVLEDLQNLYGAIDGKSEKEFTYRTTLSRVIKNVKSLCPPEGFPAPGCLHPEDEKKIRDVVDRIPGNMSKTEVTILEVLKAIDIEMGEKVDQLMREREALQRTRKILMARVLA